MRYISSSIAVLALIGEVSAEQLSKHHHHRQVKSDSFDHDPTTASMYDDQHVYSKPGKFESPEEEKEAAKKEAALKTGAPEAVTEESLSQHYRGKGDTFDNDPDTASMYDDGWVYSHPGKFTAGDKMAGITKAGPPKVKDTEMAANPASSAVQVRHHKKNHHHKHHGDTFDNDPDTASMYDDGWVYSHPGKFTAGDKMAGITKAGPPKVKDTEMAANPASSAVQVRHHRQYRQRDTYDHDPTTTSMYDDGHVYTPAPGTLNWKFAGGPKAEFEAAQAKAKPEPSVAEALVQHKHHHSHHHPHHRHGGGSGQDTFDHDPDTVSMYDDQHAYSAPGTFQASADTPKKKTGSLAQHIKRDTYDHDPTTASMYDDGHVYTPAPGTLNWKFAGGPKAEFEAAQAKAKPEPSVAEALVQRTHKDTYDHDPTTASMYDDGHVYTPAPGTLNWKFAGGPKAEFEAAQAKAKPEPSVAEALVQRTHKDTYDHDPTTASMYDDGHVYTPAPGTLNWKFAGGPKAEFEAAQAKAKPEPVVAEALVQRNTKDSFDHDADTASMYDDQHVYSKPGQFTPSAPSVQQSGKKTTVEKDTTPAGNPDAPALSQKRSKDTFDIDDKQSNLSPQDASMYDDQHVYTHTPGSLKNTPVKGALIQSTDKISVDAELDAVAKKWIASKNSANTTSTANTTSNATVNATTKANATQASQVNKTTVTAVKAEDLKKTKVNATDMPSDPVGQGAKTVANMTANATIAKKKSAADMPSDPVGQGAKTVANVTANATIATQKK